MQMDIKVQRHLTKEHRIKLSLAHKGKNKSNTEGVKRMSEKLKGRTKYNDIGRKKTSESLTRKDITKEKILESAKYITKTINNISKGELWKYLCKDLNCSISPILSRFNNNSQNILDELEITLPAKSMMHRIKLKNKWLENKEERCRKISEATKKAMQKAEIRNKFLEKVARLDITRNIIKYNKNITKGRLREEVIKKLNCSMSPIIRVLGSKSLQTILNELNVNIPNNTKWQNKEKLGLELCIEVFGAGQIKPYYKNIGYPDYIPKNTNHPIIDIKSTLNDISIEQKNKYEKIREDIKFMVFEDKGSSIISQDKIIYMKEIIQLLSNDKRIIFEEKYERIKNNIPNEQRILK